MISHQEYSIASIAKTVTVRIAYILTCECTPVQCASNSSRPFIESRCTGFRCDPNRRFAEISVISRILSILAGTLIYINRIRFILSDTNQPLPMFALNK